VTKIVTQSNKMLLVLALSLLTIGAVPRYALAQSTSASTDASAAATGAPDATIVPVGPADPLVITVIGEPDLSSTYTVDPDGDIQMPYIGKVHVAGLSVDQAQALIEQKLSDIYTSPQVSVNRPGLGGISVTVDGDVAKQGINQMRRDARLNDVVQLSVPNADADLKHINVTHGLPGQRHTTVTFDLTSYLNNGDVDGDPTLQDGDVIFVPKASHTTNSVSVTGEVTKPGRYDVTPGATAFDVIQLAGGLTTDADPTATYIQPQGTTTQESFNFTTAAQNPANTQLNPILNDGDQIVVPMAQTYDTYSILGGVLKPGIYPLKGTVSLLDAIAIAGGLEPRAKSKSTKITRKTTSGPQVIIVDASNTKIAATTYLQSGDNILIDHGGSTGFNPFNSLGVVGTILDIFRL